MNYQSHLRKIRSKIFDYDESKAEKADRVLLKLKKKVIEKRDRPAGGTNYHWMYAAE